MTDIQANPPAHLVHPHVRETHAWNDDEILASVLNAFLHNSGVPSDHIRAQVKQGRVILSGIVCQHYESSLAEQLAAFTPGAKQVENNLTCENR
jgi:osmotically-inducible protein OsmY